MKISYVIVWMTLAIHRSVAKTQKISIQFIIAYEKICDYFCAGGRSKTDQAAGFEVLTVDLRVFK